MEATNNTGGIEKPVTPQIMQPPVHHGGNIAKLRDIYGYNQTKLAEILGWRQQRVSDIEDMEVIPDDIIIEVASAFGVNPAKIKYNNIHDEAIKVFKADSINAGGMMCDRGEQKQTFYTDSPKSIEKISQFANKLISKEKELRKKDSEIFKTKLDAKTKEIELEKRAQALAQKEIELLQKEIASLKQS